MGRHGSRRNSTLATDEVQRCPKDFVRVSCRATLTNANSAVRGVSVSVRPPSRACAVRSETYHSSLIWRCAALTLVGTRLGSERNIARKAALAYGERKRCIWRAPSLLDGERPIVRTSYMEWYHVRTLLARWRAAKVLFEWQASLFK